MRICIITHEFPPNVSTGSGRYATNLVKELIKRGHDVVVVCPKFGNEKGYEKRERLKIYRLRLQSSKTLSRITPNILDQRVLFNVKLKGFFSIFPIGDYDILHMVDEHVSFFLDDEIKKKVSTIISVNQYYALESSWNILKFPYFCSDLLLRYLAWNIIKIFDKKSLKKADAIIPDTRYAGESVHKYAGVSKERIFPIYKGVDVDKFIRPVSDKKYGTHKLLYIGSNMERKGVDYIIRAMPHIVDEYPDAELTIIGKASSLFRRKIHKLIKEHNLQGHVKCIPHCPADKIPDHFAEANVFVLAPIIEDLAQVLLEAMSTRTPVVCTDVGANPEGIVDGVTGFLVPPKDSHAIADAVKRVFSDPNLARRLGNNGLERVRTVFNAPRMFRETMGVYDDIVKGRK